MKFHKRTVGASLAAGGLLLGAVACSSAATSSGADSKAVLLIGPQEGGPLSATANPLLPGSNITNDEPDLLVYEPLMIFNKATSVETPWLATSYSVSSNGKAVTFNLRPGVDWSNGTPFTASDVAFTFNLMKKYPALNKDAIPVAGATAVSKYKAVLNLSSPAYQTLTGLTGILGTDPVPEKIWAKIKNPVTYQDTHPVGTGPYVLKSFSPEVATLVANSHYWQKGLPVIKTVRFIAETSDPSMTAAMKTGAVDWESVDKTAYTLFEHTPGFGTFNVPSTPVSLVPNTTNPLLGQTAVRVAINDALNRKAIVDAANGTTGPGLLTPVTSPTGIDAATSGGDIASSLKSATYPSSSAKAKSVLEAAGYKLGSDGVFTSPSGSPLEFTVLVASQLANWVSAEVTVAQELKQAGIGTTVHLETLDAVNAAVSDGDFQLAFVNSGASTPYQLYQQYFQYGNSAPVGKPALYDAGRYDDTAAIGLLQAVEDDSPNGTAGKSALAGLEKLMITNAPAFPLFYSADYGQYNTKAFTGWPTATNPYNSAFVGDNPEVVILKLRPVG